MATDVEQMSDDEGDLAEDGSPILRGPRKPLPPPPPAHQEVFTVEEAAAFLGMAPCSVRTLISTRKLGHLRIGPNGGRIRIRPSDCEAYLESCQVVPRSPGSLPVGGAPLLRAEPIDSEGPIDPQFQISDGAGGMTLSPAQAIIDQFEKAKLEIAANPAVTPAWMPILQRLGTGLLQQCLNGIQLSKTLVQDWVKNYMLAGEPDADAKAQAIVDYLANHNVFYSHGRRVGIDNLKDKGAKIDDITVTDMVLWANVERAWYGIQHTFDGTGVFKLFENSRGRTFARSVMVKLFPVSGPPPTSSTTSAPPFDLM